MKGNKNGLFNNIWFMRIISLVLAIFLFVYVNGSGSKNGGFTRQNSKENGGTALTSDKTMSIKMPLELKMNGQKYVVSGYPEYVKVRVTGPSALVTTASNTQNFKVYANLTKLKSGNHTVKLKTSGLNSELHASIKPKTIRINIQPRRTITTSVQVKLSSNSLTNNYSIGTPKPAMRTVQVTGARSQVRRVAKVIAYVDVPRNITSNFSRQVTLQAVDKKGRTVHVAVMPSSINVDIPVSRGNSNDESSSSDSSSSSASGSSTRANDSSNESDTAVSNSSSSSH